MIELKKTDVNAVIPTRGTEYAAGYDLYSIESYELQSLERKLFKTGINIAIPAGLFGRISPRSGLSFKNGIDVLGGTIDEDYRGEIKVILINFGKEPYKINIGDKMAQIIFSAYTVHEFNIVNELSQTERSERGFGSTDIKSEPIPKEIDKLDAAIEFLKIYDKNTISITKESIGVTDLVSSTKGHVTHDNTLPTPPRSNSDLIEQYKKHGGVVSHIKPYEEQIREKIKNL